MTPSFPFRRPRHCRGPGLPDLDLTPLPPFALPAITPPPGVLDVESMDGPMTVLREEGLQ